MSRALPALLAAALVVAAPARAEFGDPDLDLPLEIRAGAPLCEDLDSLVVTVKLALQGASQMAAEVPGCFALRRNTRVYIMDRIGEMPVLRVRWRQSNGTQVEAWTLPFFLNNVTAPTAPQTTGPRRRS